MCKIDDQVQTWSPCHVPRFLENDRHRLLPLVEFCRCLVSALLFPVHANTVFQNISPELLDDLELSNLHVSFPN